MADTIFCSQCGTRLDAQSRFCSKCGSTVLLPASAAAPPPPPAAQYQPVAGAAPAMAPQPPQMMTPAVGVPPATPPQYTAPQTYAPQAGYVAAAPAYAGFWMRLGAYLIDIVVLFIPLFILALVPGVNFIAGLVGPWLYFALQESSERQATIGKRALNMYVTDLQGRRLTFGRATGRHFGRLLCVLTLGIGYLMVAFTERKQGLHDMVAATLVWRKS